MIQKTPKRLSLRALIVDDELGEPTAEGRATRALVQELQGRGVEVVEAVLPEDAMSGTADGPHLSYLRALSSWDGRFPGFGHVTHGVEHRNGTWYVQCLKNLPRQQPLRSEAETGELVAR
jgi:hypothetical protein